MIGFTNILHPTDFSEASQYAGERAVDFAKQCGAKLTVLHAYASPAALEGGFVLPDPVPELEAAIDRVADDPHVEVERVLRVGTPAETIVEFAERHHCDLIVMGTHGRTGLGHLLMGSTAEKVIRTARCPVMVVSPRAAEPVEPLEPHVTKTKKAVTIV